MARVRAVLARSQAAKAAPEGTEQRLKFQGLEIDLAGREVYVDGKRASMTPKEYDLLFYLVKNKGLALSRDKLLEEVWGYDFSGTTALWIRISRCCAAALDRTATLSLP